MSEPWKADRHPDGWAVYRKGRGAREIYRLRTEPRPMVFDTRAAAVVWAEILNARGASGR